MKPEDEIILSCRNLSKTYDNGRIRTKVLKNVNVAFNKGSINLIFGKSGSGKTTLLNILASLDNASEGEIYYRDKRYGSMNEAARSRLRGQNFGFVFQAYHLIPRISIEENIWCPLYINGQTMDEEYYEFLVRELGIEDLKKKMPHELSGGEQQRVAIARAMILKPKVIFADEPTGNLDSENTRLITDLFQKLNKEYHTTFIIVTHEENLMEECDQWIRLKDGEIVIESQEKAVCQIGSDVDRRQQKTSFYFYAFRCHRLFVFVCGQFTDTDDHQNYAGRCGQQVWKIFDGDTGYQCR